VSCIIDKDAPFVLLKMDSTSGHNGVKRQDTALSTAFRSSITSGHDESNVKCVRRRQIEASVFCKRVSSIHYDVACPGTCEYIATRCQQVAAFSRTQGATYKPSLIERQTTHAALLITGGEGALKGVTSTACMHAAHVRRVLHAIRRNPSCGPFPAQFRIVFPPKRLPQCMMGLTQEADRIKNPKKNTLAAYIVGLFGSFFRGS
jgi:hypothetical protein